MIEIYKLLSGKYDSQVALKLPLYLLDDHHTRGNSHKLLVKRCYYDLRKYTHIWEIRYYMFVSSKCSIQISISSPVRLGKLRFLG